eukprot:evm.model.scf_1523.3 EVM.evm.TU.scf_1523.3   scf_1523:35761-38040(+)
MALTRPDTQVAQSGDDRVIYAPDASLNQRPEDRLKSVTFGRRLHQRTPSDYHENVFVPEAAADTGTHAVPASPETIASGTAMWIRRVLSAQGEIYTWRQGQLTSEEQMKEEARDVLGTHLLDIQIWLLWHGISGIPMASGDEAKEFGAYLEGATAKVGDLVTHILNRIIQEGLSRREEVGQWLAEWKQAVNQLAALMTPGSDIQPDVLDYVQEYLSRGQRPAAQEVVQKDIMQSMSLGDLLVGKLCCPPIENCGVPHNQLQWDAVGQIIRCQWSRLFHAYPLWHMEDRAASERSSLRLPKVPTHKRSNFSQWCLIGLRCKNLTFPIPHAWCSPDDQFYDVDTFQGLLERLDGIMSSCACSVVVAPWFVAQNAPASWTRQELGLQTEDENGLLLVKNTLKRARGTGKLLYVVSKGLRMVYSPTCGNALVVRAEKGQEELQFTQDGNWKDVADVIREANCSRALSPSCNVDPDKIKDFASASAALDYVALCEQTENDKSRSGTAAKILGVDRVEWSSWEHEKAMIWFKNSYLVFTGQTWLIRRNPRWKRVWKFVTKTVKSVKFSGLEAFGFGLSWSFMNVSQSRWLRFFWSANLHAQEHAWIELQSSRDFETAVTQYNVGLPDRDKVDWRYVQASGEVLMAALLPIAFKPYGPHFCWSYMYNSGRPQEEDAKAVLPEMDYEALDLHPVSGKTLLVYEDDQHTHVKRKHMGMRWARLGDNERLADARVSLAQTMDEDWEDKIRKGDVQKSSERGMVYIGGCS